MDFVVETQIQNHTEHMQRVSKQAMKLKCIRLFR